MKQILLLCLLISASAFAADSTRTLRISTWPAGAEIYIDGNSDSFLKPSERISPNSLELSAEDSIVRVTLFKPGYADSTVNIHITSPEKNFIWIELKEETDLNHLEWQESVLNYREDRKIAKNLFFASLAPIALSGAFLGIAEWNFSDADDTRKKIESSTICEGSHYQKLQSDFKDSKNRGKNFRTASFVSLGIGAALLVGALVFYF